MTLLRKRLEALRDEVRTLVDEKGASIDPLRLSSELDRIINQSETSKDHLLRKYQHRMELWKETRLEMTRAVIGFGQGAIRSLVLINGGAAIAVMTFIGNSKNEDLKLVKALSQSLLLFSSGVAAAALVAGFAYVAQFLYDGSSGRMPKLGIGFHYLAVLVAMISLALFVWGLVNSYFGFQQSVNFLG